MTLSREEISKAKHKARALVMEARKKDKKIHDIESGVQLIRALSGDYNWDIYGNNQEMRLYHLLFLLSGSVWNVDDLSN